MEKGKNIQCLDRALDLLELLAEEHNLGATDISKKMGLHVATAHNIVRTLAARGYVLNLDGKYSLGPGAALLARGWNPVTSLADVVDSHLKNISQNTGEAASATVLLGNEAHLIGFCAGTQEITIHFPSWHWPNPLGLATGKVLLAYSGKSLQEEVLEKNKQHLGQSPEELKTLFSAIKDAGYYERISDSENGQYAVAFPLKTAGNRVVAAMGASCPLFRATTEHRKFMREFVQVEAQTLSSKLGWQPNRPTN